MKKLLLLAALLPAALFGAANDLPLTQWNAGGTAPVQRVIAPDANSMLGFDGSKVVSKVSIAASLSLSSGTLSVVSAPIWTTGRTLSITGDLAYTSPSFNGSANVTAAGTLATVNSNVGTFGSATQSITFTVNAKGLVTAASHATITPAVGSITGLGTGVATALGVNVGSAGAFVVFNGDAGTPSALVGTNITGTAAAFNIGGSAASLSISGQTGLLTFTGLTSTNRTKTVRDAADTILELGGSYTPTGTWTNLTLVTPALGTPQSADLVNATYNVGNPDTTITRSAAGIIDVEGNVVATTAAGATNSIPRMITMVFSGAGSPLTTGTGIHVKIPLGFTVTGYTMTCTPSGSVTFNIFRSANGGGLPTASIINNAGGGSGSGTLPAISSGVEGSSTTLTNWGSTTMTALDNVAGVLSTVDGVVTAATIILYGR